MVFERVLDRVDELMQRAWEGRKEVREEEEREKEKKN